MAEKEFIPPFDLAGILNQHRSKGRPQSRAATNYASMIGNPCLRYLYLMRTDGDQRKAPDESLRSIFREGYNHETLTENEIRGVQDLLKCRLSTVDSSGQQFAHDFKEGREIILHCRVDGSLIREEGDYPYEFKSMAPGTWNEIKTLPDRPYEAINGRDQFLNSSKFWVRRYPAQIMVFLLAKGREMGVMLCKNKISGLFKALWFTLITDDDFDFANSIIQKGLLINEAVKKRESPPGLNKPSDCLECDLLHVCNPAIAGEGTLGILDGADSQELTLLLKKYSDIEKSLDNHVVKTYRSWESEKKRTREKIKEIASKMVKPLPTPSKFTTETAEDYRRELIVGDHILSFAKPYKRNKLPAVLVQNFKIDRLTKVEEAPPEKEKEAKVDAQPQTD